MAVRAKARAAIKRLMSNILVIPYPARDPSTITQHKTIHPASHETFSFLYIPSRSGVGRNKEPGLIAEHLQRRLSAVGHIVGRTPLQINLEKQNPTISVQQGYFVDQKPGDLQGQDIIRGKSIRRIAREMYYLYISLRL